MQTSSPLRYCGGALGCGRPLILNSSQSVVYLQRVVKRRGVDTVRTSAAPGWIMCCCSSPLVPTIPLYSRAPPLAPH
jgi:hypothetical protein